MQRVRDLLATGLLTMTLVACTTAQAAPAVEPPSTLPPAEPAPQRTITVVGTGKVSIVPDVARVNVGADAVAETVSEAKSEVEGRTEAIVAALRGMGIPDRDIQTSHYTIHYDREPVPASAMTADPESQGGYRVSTMLRVIVRDVDKAGAVLDAAIDAGANQVHGVVFTVEDESLWQGQAREMAMADAKARAGELARLAGVGLGEVVAVSEVIGGFAGGIVSPERGMGGAMAPGELELSTRVQVAFAIR